MGSRYLTLLALLLASTPSALAERVVSGVVRDDSGRPVPDAEITLRPAGAFTSETGTTDAQGRFELRPSQKGPYLVGVSVDGYALWAKPSVEEGADLSVTLSHGRFIEGTVVDAATEQPIAGARVDAMSRQMGLANPLGLGRGGRRTTADERGRFRIDGLPDEPVTLTGSASGYGRTDLRVAADEPAALLALSPGVGLRGRVLGPDGAPVKGAEVTALQNRHMQSWSASASSEETEADGDFALFGLEPGPYRLSVTHDAFAFLIVPDVVVDSRDVALGDLEFGAGATIVGRLVDVEDRALSGKVRIQTLDGEPLPVSLRSQAVETASDGRFELERLPPGEYDLLVESSGFASESVTVAVTRRGETLEAGEIVLGNGLAIAGHVLDRDGAPVVGAQVYAASSAYLLDMARGVATTASTETDSEGQFRIAGLEARVYRVSATAKGFPVGGSFLEVEGGTPDVVLVLSRGGTIRARVVDEDGAAVASVDVSLRPVPPVRSRFGRRFGPVETEPGRLLVEDLDPGGYVLVLSAPGLEPTPVTRIDVESGEVTDVGTVVLREGGRIRGWVVDASDTPVAGARVRPRDQFPYSREPAMTDAAGYFELEGLPEGVVDVTVTHVDYAEATVEDVELRPESGPTTITVRMTQGGRIEGVVRSRDGGGVGGRAVHLSRPRGFLRESTTTDVDGRFALERVPAGLVAVQLLSQDPNVATNVQEKTVTVVEGETASVEFDSRQVIVSGQVTKGGVTLSGVSVSFWPENVRGGPTTFASGAQRPVAGPLALKAVTAGDGFYELYVDAPGSYEVTVSSLDRATRFPRKEIVIPDAPAVVVDLDFSSASVSGRVVSKQTQEPVVEARVRVFPSEPGAVASTVDVVRTNAAGSFHLELEPGRYTLQVGADGFSPLERTIASADGAPELLLELERGRVLRGRVLDGNGRAPARFYVRAVEDTQPTSAAPRLADWAVVDPDGIFELRDLAPLRYNVLAGSDLDGLAFVAGVEPGAELTLTLRPAAWVQVRVVGPDGAPVSGVPVAVTAVGGRKARGVQATTDAEGRAQLYAPAGSLELKSAKGDDLVGVTTVHALEGERLAAEIVLSSEPR